LTSGGSRDAHTINPRSASAAGSSDLRDHSFRLRKWRGRQRLRWCCNRQGEASNSNQLNHRSAPLFHRLSPIYHTGRFAYGQSINPFVQKVTANITADHGLNVVLAPHDG
jgi:hypothetical protein